jgi:hypothetical protein
MYLSTPAYDMNNSDAEYIKIQLALFASAASTYEDMTTSSI